MPSENLGRSTFWTSGETTRPRRTTPKNVGVQGTRPESPLVVASLAALTVCVRVCVGMGMSAGCECGCRIVCLSPREKWHRAVKFLEEGARGAARQGHVSRRARRRMHLHTHCVARFACLILLPHRATRTWHNFEEICPTHTKLWKALFFFEAKNLNAGETV